MYNIRLIDSKSLAKLPNTTYTFSLVAAAALQYAAYAFWHKDVPLSEAFQFTTGDVRGYDDFFYKNGFIKDLDLK